MKNLATILFFLTVLWSCQNESNKPINFEDVRPRTTYKPALKKGTEDTLFKVLDAFNNDSLKLTFSSLKRDLKPHFLDRFSTELSGSKVLQRFTKWILFEQKDSTQFGQWFFKDSIQCKNARYNWLDHYGAQNKSINMFESTKLDNQDVLILFNTKSITSIRSTKAINSKNWVANQRLTFPKDSTQFLLIQKNGKLCSWERKKDAFTFIKIKP